MKALIISFFAILMLIEPIIADLAVDSGSSWAYVRQQEASYCPDSGRCHKINWIILGDDSYKNGNYNEALENYANALEINKHDNLYTKVIKHYIGDTLFKLGRYEEALQIYKEIQEYYDKYNYWDALSQNNEYLKDLGAALIS